MSKLGAMYGRVVVVVCVVLLSACVQQKPKKLMLSNGDIDNFVEQMMAEEDVQGLALAVIDAGKVAYVKAYGMRNAEESLALNEQSIMYGASLTKPAVAYMLMQLVDEGLLDLDATIADLLPKPLPEYALPDYDYRDLAGDERWRALTPRILLSHRGGFANFRWLDDDERLRFHFDPGERYAYSAEGYYILQLLVEEGLGLNLEDEMRKRVFIPFKMPNTSLKWREDFALNLADGYAIDGSMEAHDARSSASAAGSMDTTITDQARMWAGILSGKGLSANARAQMFAPVHAIKSRYQFPTLVKTEEAKNKDINLAAALGLIVFQDDSGTAFFKGGHNPWTGNMVICLQAKKQCVVMLANDVRAEKIYPRLTEKILGKTAMPWTWEYAWYNEESL